MISGQSSSTETTNPSGQASERRPKETLTTIAGLLTIVAGLLALTNGLRALLSETAFLWLDIDIALNRFSVCGILVTAVGALAIAGGISAVRGKYLTLALAGAALGMVGDGIAGFFLGLTAIILLFLSNEDI